MQKLSEIRIRDPFIVPWNGMYYLYGTTMSGVDLRKVYFYRSADLSGWEGPFPCFTIPKEETFWAKEELWAPEVHLYNGKFYLFVSIMGKGGLRGTQIAVSDTPDGEFLPVADRPATPLNQSCIDGTLFVENGEPYIIYSHDWPDNYRADVDFYDGEICAQQLTKDLTAPVGEPFTLFASSEAPCSKVAPARHGWQDRKNIARYGSDGPFITRLSDGKLFMIWSPIPANNYIVGAAVADSIRGPWNHLDELVYSKNGGHGMFFHDFDGSMKMCIHYPEHMPDERALLLDVEERGGMIRVK